MQLSNEELLYCQSCGAANKKSAVTCCACEKKLNKKSTPFCDFLKDHIKEALQDNITENVFSLIKNFLLSHLYGTVLTLCVIATVCMSVYASLPPKGVAAVRQHPLEAAEQVRKADASQENINTDNLAEAFYGIIYDYDLHALATLDPDVFEDGEMPMRSTDDLFAERALPGYAHPATHDFLAGAFHAEGRAFARTRDETTGMCIFDFDTLSYNADAKTNLGKQLHKAGYNVAELNLVSCYIEGHYGDEASEAYVLENAELKIVYQFTFIEENGKWYVANDVRL